MMQTTSLNRYDNRYDHPRATLTTYSMPPHDVRRSSGSSNSKAEASSSGLHYALAGLTSGDHQAETSIALQLWYPGQLSGSSSSLSKAPILRDVPTVKRKLLTKRDRESGILISESRSLQGLKSAGPSWLREKPSRQRLNGPASGSSSQRSRNGTWRRVTAICRENGVLLIYGEDRALIHSISARDLLATDLRLVDDSLLARPNVLGIFSRPSTLYSGISSPVSGSSAKAPATISARDEPIYLSFPTSRKAKQWKSLLSVFAKPEVYGNLPKGITHRSYRQINLSLLEAKLAVRGPSLSAAPSGTAFRSNFMAAMSMNDGDELPAPPLGLGLSSSTSMNKQEVEDVSKLPPSNTSASASASASTSTLSLDDPKDERGITSEDSNQGDNRAEERRGPISGLSGRERMLESTAMAPSSSGMEMDRWISTDGIATPQATCCCQVRLGDEIVGQTRSYSGPSNVMTWFDKLVLRQLPRLSTMYIDVLQQSGKNGRVGLLGTVELPLETMRRGEQVEGWFPIWIARFREGDTEPLTLEACNCDEMVGEMKLSITVAEETILPLKKYAEMEETLHAKDALVLIRGLCKELDEDQVMSHLVDIYTSKGTIVQRLQELAEAECSSFGDNPALLFRSNTLLTRAVDKFQRLYCRDWLDACIGPTVRRICQDAIHIEATDAPHYYSNPPLIQEAVTAIPLVAESNLDVLLRLCRDLWNSIYTNRHRCPRDLRIALSTIRAKVDARFPRQPNLAGPGIQGVGAFVFLRLICPAITSPNLYGLMGVAPTAACSKTLILVAKVFLALANKKSEFDKDKEPWLVQANHFLATQAYAYDDFITFVSTPAPDGGGSSGVSYELTNEPFGDESDGIFRRQMSDRARGLPSLHRESLGSPDYMMDRTLALAAFASFVVREANVDSAHSEQQSGSGKDGCEISTASRTSTPSDEARLRYHQFIDVCCDIEDKAGFYLDRAGYQPEPVDISATNTLDDSNTKSTQVYAGVRSQQVHSAAASPAKSEATKSSLRVRRATVSETKMRVGCGRESFTPTSSMGSMAEEPTPLRRLPMHFGPHLETSADGRGSLEGDGYEDPTQRSGQQAGKEVSTPSRRGVQDSFHEIRSQSALSTSEAVHLDEQGSVRKSKRGWWKKG